MHLNNYLQEAGQGDRLEWNFAQDEPFTTSAWRVRACCKQFLLYLVSSPCFDRPFTQ